MKVTIINSARSDDPELSRSITNTAKELNRLSIEVQQINCTNMHLNYCIGCWDCWWKTPGNCVHKDDMEQIYKAILHTDFLIFATPLVAGFVSSDLKKINDRMVALIHPYLQIIQGECHHKKRYPYYPDFALILQPEETTDQEDIDIITSIYKRFAINFHSHLRFVFSTENSPTDAAKKIADMKHRSQAEASKKKATV